MRVILNVALGAAAALGAHAFRSAACQHHTTLRELSANRDELFAARFRVKHSRPMRLRAPDLCEFRDRKACLTPSKVVSVRVHGLVRGVLGARGGTCCYSRQYRRRFTPPWRSPRGGGCGPGRCRTARPWPRFRPRSGWRE